MEFYDYEGLAFNDYFLSMAYDFDNPKDPDYVPDPVGMEISDTFIETLPNAEQSPVGAETPYVATATFLDLPEDIQIQIFEYAGLLRPNLIDISFENVRYNRGMVSYRPHAPVREVKGSRVSLIYERPDAHRDTPIPVNVFLASRAVREEAGRLFFTHNDFSLFLHHKIDYTLFHSSLDWGFEHMTSLYVDLGPRDHRSLKIAPGIHRTIMKMWTSFCNTVEQRMHNLQDFSLKCRVKELEVATKLIGAMDPFPPLLYCAINLGHHPDDDILPVVKRGVWRLTNNLGNRPPFPFLRLPKEVQYLVLEELLIMRVDPYIRMYEAYNTKGVVTFTCNRRQRNSNVILSCCNNCSPMAAMCFCHARQTAFSTTCNCFSSPVPYFLVSCGFYEDARRVFFSKNSFAFMEEDPDTMMRALHCIPTASFAHMTRLIFKYPVGRYSYRAIPRCNMDMVSWSILRRFIREHFTLSRLSIVIIDPGVKRGTFVQPLDSHHQQSMRHLLKAFSDLHGLREFRVYLGNDRGFEKDAERAVMGRLSGRSQSDLPFIKPSQNRSA